MDLLGGRQVTRFNQNGEQYDVIVQVAPDIIDNEVIVDPRLATPPPTRPIRTRL